MGRSSGVVWGKTLSDAMDLNYRAVNLRDGYAGAVWNELAGADGDDGRDGAEALSRAAGV